MDGLKVCTKCGESKPKEGFYKKKKATDGLQSWCKDCARVRGTEWYREHKEERYENYKRWKRDNPDKNRESQRNYWRANPEIRAAKHKRWRQNHPEGWKAARARRRAALTQQAPLWLTPEHRAEMREFYKKASVELHVDHIWPLRGKDAWGLHVPWNLQHLPARENKRKANKPPETAT